jgi:hypothetical protein
MNDLTRLKYFPLNYPDDAVKIIDALSVSKGKHIQVVGSQNLQSQQYAGDYDLIETPPQRAISTYVRELKAVVRRLLDMRGVYIGDIKCGEVPEWKLVFGEIKDGAVVGYDYHKSMEHLRFLEPHLDAAEIRKAKRLLVERPTVKQFFKAKDILKFHIVRWTPAGILRGDTVLRDGRKYTLADGIKSGAVTKIDAIAFVLGRFVDFSCIYLFKVKGRVHNALGAELEESIKQDLVSYMQDDNWLKVAKRIFSIARLRGDIPTIQKLTSILNSDLGKLYNIVSDSNTMLYLLENIRNIPMEKVRDEIDAFRARLGTLYTIPEANKPSVLSKLLETADLRKPDAIRDAMEGLVGFFERILNADAQEALKHIGLFPVPNKYLP